MVKRLINFKALPYQTETAQLYWIKYTCRCGFKYAGYMGYSCTCTQVKRRGGQKPGTDVEQAKLEPHNQYA